MGNSLRKVAKLGGGSRRGATVGQLLEDTRLDDIRSHQSITTLTDNATVEEALKASGQWQQPACTASAQQQMLHAASHAHGQLVQHILHVIKARMDVWPPSYHVTADRSRSPILFGRSLGGFDWELRHHTHTWRPFQARRIPCTHMHLTAWPHNAPMRA